MNNCGDNPVTQRSVTQWVACPRCAGKVATRSLDDPNICDSPYCPVVSPAARLYRARLLGELADRLARHAAARDQQALRREFAP